MNTRFYLPNLNGLRFIAALAVIVGHVELSKKSFGIPNLIQSDISYFSKGGGHLGVVLFFVLSGFLITLLLLKERELKNEINFKKFFMRRVLRIWPLYFLFISIIIFIFHGYESLKQAIINQDEVILLYFLILPNVAISGIGTIPYIAHLWSIGVEEQFYLIWPVLFKKLKDKYILVILFLIFITIPLIPHLCDFLSLRIDGFSKVFNFIKLFFSYFLINAMACGAFMAYLYLYKQEFIKRILTKNINIILTIGVFVFWIIHPNLGFFRETLFSVLFAIMILGLSVNKGLFLLENTIVNYLGKVSYGLYVYHWLIIGIVNYYLLNNNFKRYNILLYSGTVFITIIVSILSYEYIEKPFLKFKNKF